MRHPFHYLSLEGPGAMHTGIVEYYDGKSIGVFLGHEQVKRFDDCLSGHRARGGVEDQFSGAAQEPQDIQSAAMRVRSYLAGLANGAPRVWHR